VTALSPLWGVRTPVEDTVARAVHLM